MPQDSLRSVVYRSLVPCDDPNGVIEGETIRRSKTSSHKKGQRIERLSVPKESDRSSIYKEGKNDVFPQGPKQDIHNPPSFQLMEVSKGANKLNDMIDSWSNGNSFDGQSKDIARDLLKGALDLQESLVMLCKLQETSNYMGLLKSKQKQTIKDVSEMDVKRNDSFQLREKINHRRMPSRPLSVDGSSRNCVDELKKVIAESLVRQNLLWSEEKASFSRRNLDIVSAIPSTSSTQSSMFHSTDSVSASVDFSVSSTTKEKKAKGPSVIAKLMGLESFPSESKKCLNGRKPVTNTEMPSARKAYLMDQTEDSKPRTLTGIIETMQLKGLLSSKDIKGCQPPSSPLGSSLSKQMLDVDELPPIVIIKPLRFGYEEKEGILLRRIKQEERPLFPKEKLVEVEPEEESLNKMLPHGDGDQELDTLLHEDKAFDFMELTRQVEVKETPIKRCSREEQALNCKEIRRKQEVKVPTSMEKASARRIKVYDPQSHKSKEKDTTNQKVEKIRKALPNRKKSVEKENVKSLSVSRSKTKVGETSTKLKKPENGLSGTKNCIQRKESTPRNPSMARSVSPIPRSSVGRIKNAARKAKAVNKSMPITSTTEKPQYNNDDQEEFKHVDKIESISTPTAEFLDGQFSTAQTVNIDIEDQAEEQKTRICKVTLQIIQHGSSTESSDAIEQLGDPETTSQRTSKTKFNMKGLLLSSPSFLSCADDLFDLHTTPPTDFEPKDREDVNDRLYLDYAKELMERKIHQTSRLGHPLLGAYLEDTKINISLNQLVEEVCDGVDTLTSYTDVGSDALPLDSIYKLLENDLKGKAIMITDVWDLAWVKGYPVNGAAQVVCEVEKHVLSGLIEEFIEDFSNSMVRRLQL